MTYGEKMQEATDRYMTALNAEKAELDRYFPAGQPAADVPELSTGESLAWVDALHEAAQAAYVEWRRVCVESGS